MREKNGDLGARDSSLAPKPLIFSPVFSPSFSFSIDHFHYDVTHAKVSGSCSKDRAQGRSFAGKFKIIRGGEANFANFRDLMIHRKLTSHPVGKFAEQLAQRVARWTLGCLWFLFSCDQH